MTELVASKVNGILLCWTETNRCVVVFQYLSIAAQGVRWPRCEADHSAQSSVRMPSRCGASL